MECNNLRSHVGNNGRDYYVKHKIKLSTFGITIVVTINNFNQNKMSVYFR
ncbi:hypothetical protein RhiirA4_489336 [Rhizophagus irregularis]|uniref:Uncharacterized protein n=1 Tax=Rhizophagus irregularis TaxID=588596 RepID=A0A2I1HUP3_9GLOM|nr:hypothetical protein RhiirA4_489336 [Rhizophagus irregularis]